MSSLDKQIADLLNGTHIMDSGEVANVIASCQDEIRTVEKALDADKVVMLDIAVTGDELDATKQRVASGELHRDRLLAAIPRLEKLVADLQRAERDEQQRAEYDALVKRRTANQKEIEAFAERVPAFARALHEAVKLHAEAKRFNVRPTPGTPVNPMDEMVSGYGYLAPYVADAFIKGTRLVAADGRVLFAPADASVSAQPVTLPQAATAGGGRDKLVENLRYQRDMQKHAVDQLQGMRQRAAAQGTTLEQVATARGYTDERLQVLKDRAEGKMVADAERELSKAQKPTS